MEHSTVVRAESANEDFAAMLDETLGGSSRFEGSIVRGRVIHVTSDFVVVDVGLKSEGLVPLKEFSFSGRRADVQEGETYDLFLERYEDRDGSIVLSREKAKREESWIRLEGSFARRERVTGTVVGRIKGGFSVDLGGVSAFLPGSQADTRPMHELSAVFGAQLEFIVTKMDRPRSNVVVSRRAVLDEARAGQRAALLENLQEGAILEGVVKNFADFGAFVDLGGADGLLHVTDIAWRRLAHPSEMLQLGQKVRVLVLRYNQENQRISLGMKQMEADPWADMATRFPVGARVPGRVTNVTDYGAFVEIEPGIEGLIHVSEISWTKKDLHPGKILSTSQAVEVVVLEADSARRRISLGLKQTEPNPWEQFRDQHPVGSVVDGEVSIVNEFGVFVRLTGELDGMIHLADLAWDDPMGETAVKSYAKGQPVQAKVLEIDPGKERIGLGLKQLRDDPMSEVFDRVQRGVVVTCVVAAVQPNGLDVSIDGGLTGFIRRSELSKDKSEQRPERFAPGETVDAKVTGIDRAARRVALSVRGKEMDEDKEAAEIYGSASSGASLGDILGAAIRRRNQEQA